MKVLSKQLYGAIPDVGMGLICGGTGGGKSCLAYGIMESIHVETPDRRIFVYNFPAEKAHLLPDWIERTDDENFPENAAVLADEAYFKFYAKL